MHEQAECRKFNARVEVDLNVDVIDGSVKKFRANNLGMIRNMLADILTLCGRNFERLYGDGMKLKLGVKNVSCTSVSEKRKAPNA